MKLLPSPASMKKLILFIFITGLLFLISCSGSRDSTNTGKFNIEYYSEGGFTGGAAGIYIDSSGTANLWEKNLNGHRKINKSFKIKDEKFSRIYNLLKEPVVFLYKNNFRGNYTTYLIIHLNDKETNISFNKYEIPENMPEPLKKLVYELNTISQ